MRSLPKLAQRKVIYYLFWAGCFIAAIIILPSYLGSLIAKNQWQMLWFLALGLLIIALYFSEFRYLIFCTAVVMLLANNQNDRIVIIFGSLRWIFLITMAVVAAAHWVLGRVPSRIRFMDLWAVAFLGLAFYSQSYSITPALTFERSVSTALFYLAVFWGGWIYIQDEAKIPVIARDLVKISFLFLLVGLISLTQNRFFGAFSNPNSVGVFSAILAPLAFWSYLCERKQYALILITLIAIGLFFSQSRGGIISTAVSVAYFLMLYRRKHAHALIILFFFLGASLLYAELFGSSFFQQYFRWENLATGGGRLEAWKEVIRLIALRPWWGYGFGTEDQLFIKFDIVFLEHAGAYAHNSYIGLISQLGFIGAFIFFVPLILFFLNNAYQVSRIVSDQERWLGLALNASILGGLANAFFESWLYSAGNSFTFPFWVIVIMAYQMAHAVTREKAGEIAKA